MQNTLIDKINDKSAVIGIVGLGYVGLPLTNRFLEVGFNVIGFDIDESKIEMLNRGESYIKHIDTSFIKTCSTDGRFRGTTDYGMSAEADALILCVPTPLGEHFEPDLSYVTSTMDSLKPYLRTGHLLSLESTTYPGTTEEILVTYVEERGFTIGEDLYVVYSPEREDPGNPSFTTRTIPKLVGGVTTECAKAGHLLYSNVVDNPVAVKSTKVAEMAKLLENIYRAVNIGLVNELKTVADKMDVNIWDVIDAAATKPFGFTPFYPGPGLGGHCIPIDPFYLTWKAREYGINTRFIELAGQVNTAMPQWVIGKVIEGLNEQKKALNGSKVLLLGVAYKKNVDDLRESPSLELIELLKDRGATVSYSDPHIPKMPKLRKHNLTLESVEITDKTLTESDCVIVATDHDLFDYDRIRTKASLVVDTRGRYREDYDNVVRA